MSKVEAMLPQLRFEGFSGEWKTQALSDVAKIVGGGTPDTAIPEYWNGDINWYSPTEIGLTRFVKESTRKITDLGFQKSSARLLPANQTVLFTSRAGIGDMAILKAEGTTNQGFQSLIVNDHNDVYFIYSMGHLIKREALRVASGSTFLEISGKALGKIKQQFPLKKEQTKIGELFQKLDRAIELQQQKVEQSERYKKAMLQKMFPQKGETEPQLRFEGFSGEWECQRLDELVFFSKGKGYSKSDLCESGVEIILYGSLYTNYQTTISKVHTFAEDKGNSVYSEGVEVLLPSSGETSVDIARASAVLKKGIILGGDLNILKPKREYNSTFLALNLTYSSANRELIKRAQGQVVVHLYNSDIAGVKLMLPTLEEQTKIGEFFQALDARIEVETKKLNHYESLKKAMLQRMFV